MAILTSFYPRPGAGAPPGAERTPWGGSSEDLPGAELTERRASVRFSPDPFVPVLFAHPDAQTPTAGLVADISDGGARIVAPPTARPHLHWGDPLTLLVSYSESTRSAGIEGLTLRASVVRIAVDAAEYVIAVRFDRANGDWSALVAWLDRLARE